MAFAIGSATFVTLEGLRRWQSRGSAQGGPDVPRKLVVTGGLAVAAIVALGGAVIQMLPTYRTMHLTDISLSGRTDIWAAGWTAFESANPLLGLGIAAFNTAVGPASSIEFEAAVLWPHSALVGVLVELGAIGFALFLATAAGGSQGLVAYIGDSQVIFWQATLHMLDSSRKFSCSRYTHPDDSRSTLFRSKGAVVAVT